MTLSETETLKMFDEKFPEDYYKIASPDVICEQTKSFLLTQLRLARADERKQAYEDGKRAGEIAHLTRTGDERYELGYEDGKNAACDFIQNHCITSRHPFEHMREVNIGVIDEARKA